jgi:hypothetical protein
MLAAERTIAAVESLTKPAINAAACFIFALETSATA